ncbi:MAG: hypothetical protein H8E53_10955 [Planctomycetes bacterium]|nr:hypothetical protein [Planctomycetota bacterium]
MSKATDAINRICGRQSTREMSSKAQCRECGAVIPVCIWQNGAVMISSATENIGGGGGSPAEHEWVCPACGERETKEDLTIDQLFAIEEAEYTDTE